MLPLLRSCKPAQIRYRALDSGVASEKYKLGVEVQRYTSSSLPLWPGLHASRLRMDDGTLFWLLDGLRCSTVLMVLNFETGVKQCPRWRASRLFANLVLLDANGNRKQRTIT